MFWSIGNVIKMAAEKVKSGQPPPLVITGTTTSVNKCMLCVNVFDILYFPNAHNYAKYHVLVCMLEISGLYAYITNWIVRVPK